LSSSATGFMADPHLRMDKRLDYFNLRLAASGALGAPREACAAMPNRGYIFG
jgi:hypothetical protein